MNPAEELVFAVSDFVGVLNQTLEYAYGAVVIEGELANFRVSKNRWVYFDLKDAQASLRFFGTVQHLPGPLEDGMMLRVKGNPRLHPLYGFSVNVMSLQPVGEGSLQKAANLLRAKLDSEGLFADQRKRRLPSLPRQIGLITSAESAAYADFTKILNERWGGVEVLLADVQVQGEPAPAGLVRAIEYFNGLAAPPEVLVLTRGGGSAEDLAAFNNELVVRAVAASRVPTLVAIGHEVDLSLAELAADQRASTPSNAAQLLVPDKGQELEALSAARRTLAATLEQQLRHAADWLVSARQQLQQTVERSLQNRQADLLNQRRLLEQINPARILSRGYALVYQNGNLLRSSAKQTAGNRLSVQFSDGALDVEVQ